MAKRKSTKSQQRSTKHTHKAKDQITNDSQITIYKTLHIKLKIE